MAKLPMKMGIATGNIQKYSCEKHYHNSSNHYFSTNILGINTFNILNPQ